MVLPIQKIRMIKYQNCRYWISARWGVVYCFRVYRYSMCVLVRDNFVFPEIEAWLKSKIIVTYILLNVSCTLKYWSSIHNCNNVECCYWNPRIITGANSFFENFHVDLLSILSVQSFAWRLGGIFRIKCVFRIITIRINKFR